MTIKPDTGTAAAGPRLASRVFWAMVLVVLAGAGTLIAVSVMLAPLISFATSMTCSSSVSRRTCVVARPFRSDFDTTKWASASPAICGRWVIAIT